MNANFNTSTFRNTVLLLLFYTSLESVQQVEHNKSIKSIYFYNKK